jgi:uncharacterized protein YegP (UPF0339 family)
MNEIRGHWTEVYKDVAGQWRWRRKAANGDIVADSAEGYRKKQDALAQIEIQFPDDEIRFV